MRQEQDARDREAKRQSVKEQTFVEMARIQRREAFRTDVAKDRLEQGIRTQEIHEREERLRKEANDLRLAKEELEKAVLHYLVQRGIVKAPDQSR